MWKTPLKLAAAASLAAMAFPAAGLAQADYPNKAIHFIVPYPPGGTVDPTARILGVVVSKLLGQPVVVDNKPGAAGSIGAEYAVRQEPDGYNVLIHTNIVASEPCLKPNLPYKFTEQMQPVTALTETPFVILTHPSIKANTVKELVDYIKKSPEKVRYGASGIGSSGHLRGEQFKLETGVDLVFIPYKGGGETLTGLMRNDVNIAIDTLPGSIAMVNDGRMKLLAVGGDRIPQVPNTPTMKESGYKPLASQWIGAYVPAKTPPAIVAKLHDAFVKALADPSVKEQFSKIVFTTLGTGPQETMKNLKEETAMWCSTIKSAGIKIEE